MAVGLVIMSERELNRVEVLRQAAQGRTTAVYAAGVSGSSPIRLHRQIATELS